MADEEIPPPPRRREPFMDKLKRKATENPLVPLGALATVFFLGEGFRSFKKGQFEKSQKMMRFRVAAQFFTIAVLVGGALYGLNPKKPKTFEEKLEQDKQQK